MKCKLDTINVTMTYDETKTLISEIESLYSKMIESDPDKFVAILSLKDSLISALNNA